jgi:uncharacterized SAM-binding protein YcdF (DUF218 family)
MVSTVIQFLVALTYPLTLSLFLCGCGALAWILRRRVLAGSLLAFALAWSCVWSVPVVSEWLRAPLVRQHDIVAVSTLPRTDAIVVLGGGTLRLDRLASSRLATAARAWLAGRAPVVILSGGSGRGGTHRKGRSEASRMADTIRKLGVPSSALMLEDRSRTTEENALFTARLAREHGIHRVLLVTSSLHMPRASLMFKDAGIDAVPVPVPERTSEDTWSDRWLPTGRAMWRSGRAFKEYAGLLSVRLRDCITATASRGFHGFGRT